MGTSRFADALWEDYEEVMASLVDKPLREAVIKLRRRLTPYRKQFQTHAPDPDLIRHFFDTDLDELAIGFYLPGPMGWSPRNLSNELSKKNALRRVIYYISRDLRELVTVETDLECPDCHQDNFHWVVDHKQQLYLTCPDCSNEQSERGGRILDFAGGMLPPTITQLIEHGYLPRPEPSTPITSE